MTWQLLVSISTISFAGTVLLQRVLFSKKLCDPITFAIFMQIVVGIMIFFYALIRGIDLSYHTLPIPNLLLMAAIYAVGNIVMFRSLKLIEASQFGILFASRALWSVLIAFFVFGEVLTPTQWGGLSLVVIAIVLVSATNKLKTFSAGHVYGLLAGFAIGAAFINDAYILKDGFDVPSFLAIAFLLPGLILAVVYRENTVAACKKLSSRPFLTVALPIVALYAIGAITIFVAFQKAYNPAVLASIAQSQVVLVVLGGIIFLREHKNIIRKIIAGVISVVGVVLLTL